MLNTKGKEINLLQLCDELRAAGYLPPDGALSMAGPLLFTHDKGGRLAALHPEAIAVVAAHTPRFTPEELAARDERTRRLGMPPPPVDALATVDIESIRARVQRFESLTATVQRFEDLIRAALEEKMAQHSILHDWSLVVFLRTYLASGVYPDERLVRLMHNLFDLKLQLYYIMEVDLGQYNQLVYARGYDATAPYDKPHVLLTRLSLDQALIGKSRVLWERLMNLIYYLEKGEELEKKASGKRSKKKVFFKFVEDTPKWRFLEPYEQVIVDYDNAYRTPEFHTDSTLRANLLRGTVVEPRALHELLNRALNSIWGNLLAIVAGDKASTFTELHRVDPRDFWSGIDPKYLE